MIIIAVLQVKPKDQTKDGRKWIFQVYYKGLDGLNKKYRSKKYMTKKEAQEAERQFLLSLDQNINHKDMTFKDLYLSFYDYQSDKVRESTIKTYRDRVKYLQYFDNIKLKDFNINHFELWKKEINKLPLATSYKNDLFKFIKAILNYGSKWYDFNFTPVYNKMTNFTNPNELKKEMLFFTIDEFNQFISVEDDIMFKPLFETLYYMGLRKGELRGLQWKDIDFKNKIMRIYKQIPSIYSMDNYKLSPLKTQNSNRDLPINDLLLADLKRLYNYKKEFKNFSQEWFVFGNDLPLTKDSIRSRKNRNCKLAQVKQIRIHDFRHSCASFLINYGASITLVAKYLGHTKIDETLNTYSHMYQNKLEDIVKLINKNNSILLAKREREKEKNTIDNDYITNEKNDIEICL